MILEDSDETTIECNPIKSSTIQKLIDNNDIDELHKLSFHYHENAFKDVCFGGDEYGINGDTPFELLHQLRQGIFDNCLQGLYGICDTQTTNCITSM